PFEEMLWNVRPLAPIVVFATLSAVPVVVESVFPLAVALTVPPPVALKALFAPVLAGTPPLKLIGLPVLVARLIPKRLSLIAPVKATVPAVWLVTSTDRPALVVVTLLAKL